MARPKLTTEQRETLWTWLAADYEAAVICAWFMERQWPRLTKQTLSYHRKRNAAQIGALRAQRHARALTVGLALKEERVARLAVHADALEILKWVADPKTGRLWNEKAWRETLDDIAREMGHRSQRVDGQLRVALDDVLAGLPDDFRTAVRAALAAAVSAPGD